MAAIDLNTPHTFRPHSTSRRGELYTWLATLVVFVTLVLVSLFQGSLPGLGALFIVVLAILAVFISLANWIERRTILEIDADGLAFRNGLRDVHFFWDEISIIEVTTRSLGRRVHVIGERSHFAFNTEGAVKLGRQTAEKTGFEQGQAILDTILENTSLIRKSDSDEQVYYYSRQ